MPSGSSGVRLKTKGIRAGPNSGRAGNQGAGGGTMIAVNASTIGS